MIIIKNNLIPFKGFSAMTIFPFILVRKDYWERETSWIRRMKILNHEDIHTYQQIECMAIGFILLGLLMFIFSFSWWYILIPLTLFYVSYAINWLINLIRFKGSKNAYYNICFEREASENEDDLPYLEDRKLFSWFKYI